MRSISLALTYETWRRGALGICTAVPALALLPLLVYHVLSYEGFSTLENTQTGRILHFAFFVMTLFFVSIGVVWLHKDLHPRFTLPVSTQILVGCHVVNGVAMGITVYVGLAIGLNVLIHAAWPVWGPAFVVGMTVACAQTIRWSFRNSPTLQTAAAATCALVIVLWASTRYGDGPTQSPSGVSGTSQGVTLGDAVLMLGVIIVAYFLAVAGVNRDRRGEGMSLEKLGRRVLALIESFLPATQRVSFKSASAAQLWYEWRRRGLVYPIFALIASTVLVGCSLCPWIGPETGLDLTAGLSVFLLMASPLLGMFMGHRSENLIMGSFYATRPMTDGQQASLVLRNVATSTLTATIVWGAGVTIAMGWFLASGQWGAITDAYRAAEGPTFAGMATVPILIGEGVLVMWTLAALGASLALSRKWFMALVINAGGFLVLANFLSIQFLVPPAYQGICSMIVVLLVQFGSLLGSGCALVYARRKGLVGAKTPWYLLLIWIGLVVVHVLTFPFPFPSVLPMLTWHQLPFVALWVFGLLALPLAPVAAAPLALSWNRHR